jgi:hypothetical protein
MLKLANTSQFHAISFMQFLLEWICFDSTLYSISAWTSPSRAQAVGFKARSAAFQQTA